MSISNVVDIRGWRNKTPNEPGKRHFASTQETLLLLRAFMAIESPVVRGEIIRTVEDVAFLSETKAPPKNCTLERDEFWLNQHPALAFCLSMIFSENRQPLFQIML